MGYDTYQKILSQAVTELKNDEFSEIYKEEIKSGEMTGEDFVDDCTVESDIEMYFPDQWVPTDSERMLLYRELDNLKNDEELARYRQRLIDRFGEIPKVADELMKVVPLRRKAKQLGCERLMLKMGRMTMFFVSNPNSPYYQSQAFDSILNYIATNPRRCNIRENNGKRSLVVNDVKSVGEAIVVLEDISSRTILKN